MVCSSAYYYLLLLYIICIIIALTGSKIWTFMQTLDHNYVDAAGKTVPPNLAAQRVFGPAVTCGRFARQFVSGKEHLVAVRGLQG